MSTIQATRNLFWATLALLAATAALQASPPTLTINPSCITNDFVGSVTLSISNLTPGLKVWVAKYPDLNGNGVVESGEGMMQVWGVMDGGQNWIGGVRNFNVPADEDGATNGTIQMVLHYPGDNAVLDSIAGQYLFQVSDPQGSFAPVTAPFTIVQKPWPQSVSGTARDAATGLPLTNAFVVMVVPDGPGGSGTFTDGTGHYALSNAPGNYALLAIRPGYIANEGAGMVSLVAGSSVTNDLSALPGSLFISGQVTDQSNTNKTISGLFVECEATNNLFSLAFTDTNGNYSLAVTPSQWKVKIKGESGLTSKGYVQTSNEQRIDIGTNSQSGVNFSFPKATALIYGRVLDNASNGVANLSVQASDSSYTESSSAISRADGSYCLGVLSGSWTAQLDNSSLASQNLLSQSSVSVNLAGNQATNVNLVVLRPSTHLLGRAVDNLGNPLGNIGLVANQIFTNGFMSQGLYSQTAADGTFNLGVFGGQWSLSLECQQSYERGLVPAHLQLNVTDGIDQSNLTVTAHQSTTVITVTITDIHGNPVSASAYASLTPTGVYSSGCGMQNNNTIQLSVFNGTWNVGLENDLTSLGYDYPPQQTVTVNGANLAVNFVVYPLGQTPSRVMPSVMNGQLQLFISGSSGHQYRLEGSTNLNASANWFPIMTNTVYGGGFWFNEPMNQSGGSRFYRTVRLQ